MPDAPVVLFKRLRPSDLPLPAYASPASAGMDLRACLDKPLVLGRGEIRLVPTGLAAALPPGFEGQIRPRSGLALKHGIGLVNAPGTIDEDYRGEISVILINWGPEPFTIRHGDRIAQMVVTRVWRADCVEVRELEATVRGTGGFGHTGVD